MIGPVINTLLDRQPNVVVPGLGMFTSAYLPAEIQFAGKAILPATRRIEFNQKVTEDSGLSLHHFLTEELGISPGRAEELLSQLVSEATTRLRMGLPYAMERFGSMATDIEGNIQFFPEAGQIFHQDSYGLVPLKAESLASRTRKILDREVPVIPLHPFDIEKEEPHTQTNPKRRIFYAGAYAAVLAALVLTFSAVYLLSDFSATMAIKSHGPVTRHEAGLVPVPSAPQESASLPPTPKESILVQPNEPVLPMNSPEPEPKIYPKSYFVIAGSFRQTGKIPQLKENLEKKGFEVSLHENPLSGFTRIAIGSFSQKDEALAFLKEAQSGFREQLWVFSE